MPVTPFPDRIAAAWPPQRWRDVTVLVAVSGGADSVALVRGLCDVRQPGEGRLILAHFNHRLRGAESDGDQAFVEDLGRRLGLEVVVGVSGRSGLPSRTLDEATAGRSALRSRTPEDAATKGSGVFPGNELSSMEALPPRKTPDPFRLAGEAALGRAPSPAGPAGPTSHGGEGLEGLARRERYEFLRQGADKCGARHVATAHTADDQVETILHNILRGTGLAGVAGIPRVRRLSDAATLVRPMLDITRADVLAYLESLQQPYRVDATNAELHFTRNRIRHVLLPLLEREFNPQVRDALLRLSQIAAQEDYVLDQHAEALLTFDCNLRSIRGGVEMDTAPLAAAPANLARHALMLLWTMQRWPLQDMSLTKWEELRQLAALGDSISPTPLVRDLPGRIRAEYRAGVLRLTRQG